jgi:hypothetical protein
VALGVDPRSVEVCGQEIGVLGLPARVRGAVVDASVSDQVLEQAGDLAHDVIHAREMISPAGRRSVP